MRSFTHKVFKPRWNREIDAFSTMAVRRRRKFFTTTPWLQPLVRQMTVNAGRPAPGEVPVVSCPRSNGLISFGRCFSSDEKRDRAIVESSETHSTPPPALGTDDAQSPAEAFTIPGAQAGGRKLAIVFTCTVCGTRSAKQFTERSYLQGVVIVRCPGCQNLHLIADRLGYFGSEDFDLDSIVRETGQDIKAFTDENVYELSLEDLAGKEKMDELMRRHEEKSHHDPS